MRVHWVSAQDLLGRASWSTEQDLLELLMPNTEQKCLLVIDDLQILANDDSEEDSLADPELLLVHNSILEALARLSNMATPSPFILGIAHETSQVARGLTRIGRLEKELCMDPPTQLQREDILNNILDSVEDTHKRSRWAQVLAAQTAGCVASDLVRLGTTAWTTAWSRLATNEDNVELSWNDLRNAAYTCVPSQLAQLDVTKTASFREHEANGPLDPLKIHELSWRKFDGYPKVKKRLYRTVVMPWRRFIASTSGRDGDDGNSQVRDSWISPPSGVLFHGPPGVGKSLAASCLASSLELHVVKVRLLGLWPIVPTESFIPFLTATLVGQSFRRFGPVAWWF